MSLLGREETISGMAATANKSQTSFRTCGEIVIKSRYKVSTETSNFVDHKRCENSFDHHPMLCTMTCMYSSPSEKGPKVVWKTEPPALLQTAALLNLLFDFDYYISKEARIFIYVYVECVLYIVIETGDSKQILLKKHSTKSAP